MRIPFRILVLGAVLGLTAGTAPAQSYTTKVVARNLQRPTGVSVALDGKVYFTQLPTPGVPGTRGGTNTVNVLNPKNGRIRTLTTGEPEPTNLATTFSGDVYWTCKSANVILTLEDGGPKLVAGELDAPTGLAAYPFGALLFFTEVPTPAVGGGNGGRNKVYAFLESANREVLLDEGDPEPNDVAVDLLGNVYWSCSSAGVIVRLSGGKTDVIARGLRRPTGLATDYLGNLYFTEVPTPGVGGAAGGQNRVSKLDTRNNRIAVIDEGDPDPIDVTAHPDGTVYWTCRSAGVIVEATPRRRR